MIILFSFVDWVFVITFYSEQSGILKFDPHPHPSSFPLFILLFPHPSHYAPPPLYTHEITIRVDENKDIILHVSEKHTGWTWKHTGWTWKQWNYLVYVNWVCWHQCFFKEFIYHLKSELDGYKIDENLGGLKQKCE